MEIQFVPQKNEEMHRRLEKASLAGDVDELRRMLQEDNLLLHQPNLLNPTNSPLHIASALGHADFVKEILARKPEYAVGFNARGFTALHLACANGHLSVVRELVQFRNNFGVEICEVRDKDGFLPIHTATLAGNVQILEEMLGSCSHVVVRGLTCLGDTILHLAVKSNCFEAIKFLVEKMEGDQEFLNLRDAEGNTILHLAMARKQLQELLICLVTNNAYHMEIKHLQIVLFSIPFDGVELTYLSSVLFKFAQGSFLPLVFSTFLMMIMAIWHYVPVKRYMLVMENKISSNYIRDLVIRHDIKRLPGIGFLYSDLVEGIPPISKNVIEKMPLLHSVLVFVSVKKNLPISTVDMKERFIFRQMELKEYIVYKCVVRYGYKDVIEDPKGIPNLAQIEYFAQERWRAKQRNHQLEEEIIQNAGSSTVQVEEYASALFSIYTTR